MMLHTKNQGTRHFCFRLEDYVCFPNIKIEQRAKPRNLYNLETPYGKLTNSRKHHTQESQEISPFPAGDHIPM